MLAGAIPWWFVVVLALGASAAYTWGGGGRTRAPTSGSSPGRRRCPSSSSSSCPSLAGRARRVAAVCRRRARGVSRSPRCVLDRAARRAAGRLPLPCAGAWPSGKATGFGPVIPGSNPGAPAIEDSVMPTRLAAVVMAGGLGTRMRSSRRQASASDPRPPMVDWVVEAARPLGAGAAGRRRLARHRGTFDGLDVAVQERPLGHRRCRALGEAGRSATRTRCSSSPATRRS